MGFTQQERALAIAKGIDKQVAQISRAWFNARLDTTIDKDDLAKHMNATIKSFGYFEWELGCAINNARYKRVQRIRERVKEIVQSGSAVFVTLTFTDNVLETTTAETRKKYVSRFLKGNSSVYVANKDFGATNGREHYHAIVSSPTKIDLSQWFQYGAINVKKVRTTQTDLVRVSKYVGKITNHAIKQTAQRQRLIYSRVVKS